MPELDRYQGQDKIKGMTVTVEYVRDSSAAGTVLSQTPAAGFTRRDTDTIHLRVSAGKSVYEKYKKELNEHLSGDVSSALAYLDFINSKEGNPKNTVVIVRQTHETLEAGEALSYNYR